MREKPGDGLFLRPYALTENGERRTENGERRTAFNFIIGFTSFQPTVGYYSCLTARAFHSLPRLAQSGKQGLGNKQLQMMNNIYHTMTISTFFIKMRCYSTHLRRNSTKIGSRSLRLFSDLLLPKANFLVTCKGLPASIQVNGNLYPLPTHVIDFWLDSCYSCLRG